MFKGLAHWRLRAIEAEQRCAQLEAAVASAQQELDGIQLRMKERAALISIARDGRINRFNFTRDGQLISIETMGMLSDDVDGWKRDLLEPLS